MYNLINEKSKIKIEGSWFDSCLALAGKLITIFLTVQLYKFIYGA